MSAALDLIAWLDRAKRSGGAAVRERYKISAQSWGNAIRPDCNTEAMLAYALAWRQTGTAAYLTRSRAIWDDIKGMQNPDGSWPFANWTDSKWVNDNSEAVVFLLRAAEVDPVNAAEYRTAALATVAWLLSQQRADGAWQNNYSGTYTPMWAGHALAAISTAYQWATPATQSAIRTAAGKAITWIATLVTGGRVRTTYEDHGAEEAWRPPSSEQAITVRGIALAELLLPAPDASWATLRHTLHGWLDPLVHTSGAMRNGYGVGVTHADVAHITDHVYTTAFAVEAYRLSWRLDHTPAYRTIADGILGFAAGNLYYSADPDANGVLRGAYDLTSGDWNTSEVAQNGGEEGGGDMAYSGWSAAPVAALLLAPLARRRGGIML